MDIGKNIFRSLGCVFIILSLLVTIPIKNGFESKKNGFAIQKDKKAPVPTTEKASKVVIKASLPETIVQGLQLQFLQVFFICNNFIFSRPLPILNKVFQGPLFILSYFENTFCHHIAINAP